MTKEQLLELEGKVRARMEAGRFRTALDEIKAAAVQHEIPYQELVGRVATLAIELGHVRPIQQVSELND
jgi:hypothetical protein